MAYTPNVAEAYPVDDFSSCEFDEEKQEHLTHVADQGTLQLASSPDSRRRNTYEDSHGLSTINTAMCYALNSLIQLFQRHMQVIYQDHRKAIPR